MDKILVKAIEAVWSLQKRLPVLVENRNNKVTYAVATSVAFTLHLTLLAVIIVMVTARWLMIGGN